MSTGVLLGAGFVTLRGLGTTRDGRVEDFLAAVTPQLLKTCEGQVCLGFVFTHEGEGRGVQGGWGGLVI